MFGSGKQTGNKVIQRWGFAESDKEVTIWLWLRGGIMI